MAYQVYVQEAAGGGRVYVAGLADLPSWHGFRPVGPKYKQAATALRHAMLSQRGADNQLRRNTLRARLP